MAKIHRIITKLLICMLQIYRWFISPLLGNHCRFYPSCSCYAMTALDLHGIFQGSWLAVKRLLRCHPLHAGGFDPVPSNHKIHACVEGK